MFKRMLWAGCVLCLVILTGCTGLSSQSFFSSDQDDDGVVSQLDRCPATPMGIAVDSNGCPADSDGDGVFDTLDRCPGTATAHRVDLRGCNMDQDADGVFDWRDHCLRSRPGIAVDLDGCEPVAQAPAAETVADLQPTTAPVIKVPADRKLIIYFEFNQSSILPEFRPMLEKLVEGLSANQVASVKISGHTDSTGREPYNLALGKKRARRVAALLAADAPQLASFMTLESFGETRPVADNGTSIGRLLNRRVEVSVEMDPGHRIADRPGK